MYRLYFDMKNSNDEISRYQGTFSTFQDYVSGLTEFFSNMQLGDEVLQMHLVKEIESKSVLPFSSK